MLIYARDLTVKQDAGRHVTIFKRKRNILHTLEGETEDRKMPEIHQFTFEFYCREIEQFVNYYLS